VNQEGCNFGILLGSGHAAHAFWLVVPSTFLHLNRAFQLRQAVSAAVEAREMHSLVACHESCVAEQGAVKKEKKPYAVCKQSANSITTMTDVNRKRRAMKPPLWSAGQWQSSRD